MLRGRPLGAGQLTQLLVPLLLQPSQTSHLCGMARCFSRASVRRRCFDHIIFRGQADDTYFISRRNALRLACVHRSRVRLTTS